MNRESHSTFRRLNSLVVAAHLFLIPFFALSDDEDITVVYDYEMTDKLNVDYQVDMHTPDLMGDVFNISTGTMQLRNIDIDIPGNSELQVKLVRARELVKSSREYSMLNSTGFIIGNGNWYFDTPRLTYDIPQNSIYWPNALRDGKFCSGDFSVNRVIHGDSLPLRPKDYNTGYTLQVPGKATATLIKNTGAIPGTGTAAFVTKSMWKISCTNSNGHEAFIAITPEGMKYIFDVKKISKSVGTLGDVHKKVSLVFFASKIEDRFGNWVKYQYEAGELKSIFSNDGRQIKIVRKADGAEVTSHGRVWRYKQNGDLVELPDGRFWSYSFPSMNELDGTKYTSSNFVRYTYGGTKGSAPHTLTSCGIGLHNNIWGNGNEGGLNPFTSLIGNSHLNGFPYTVSESSAQPIRIHHPDGATGKFWLGLSLQGKTNVDPDIYYAHNASHITAARCYLQPSLMKKSIEYQNGKEYEWHYQYSNNWGSYISNSFISESRRKREEDYAKLGSSIFIPDNVDDINYKIVKVVNPDGSYLHHYINRNYQSHLENSVINTTYFDAQNNILKESRNEYKEGIVWGTEPKGLLFNKERQKSELSLPKIKSSQTLLYSSNKITKFTKDYKQFNAHDQATLVHHYNNYSNDHRYFKFRYFNDTFNWHLGQLSSLELAENGADYTLVKDVTYHNITGSYRGLPNCYNSFGRKVYCHTSYWTESNFAGSPRRITLNAGNRWVEYANYKRGVPQIISKPNSTGFTTKHAYNEVDDNGLVTKFTDYEGNCTSFDYNLRGLRTTITPCDSKWAKTNVIYSRTSNSEGNQFVEAGMFKQSVSRSTYRKNTYFDYMLRPILIKEWDAGSTDNTTRYYRTNYDFENKITYNSRAHTWSSTPYGVFTQYDALGRIVSIDNNTIAGFLSYAYLDGNRISETDNLGNVTTTSYLSYGSPSYQKAKKINAPEGVTTVLDYNLFGNVTSISQGGFTEYLVYDAHQSLCKTVRADVGNTAYYYNSLGELQWKASGNSVNSSTSACDNSVSANQKTTYIYDNLGKVKKLDYGDGSIDKVFTYDKNGNIKTIHAGGVTNSYSYNTANLIDNESVSINGKTFTHNYEYSKLAILSAVEYPNGELVEYEPNALGQPTIVGGYAHSVKYHPDGTLSEFVYGNGFTHKTEQGQDGLPKSIKDFNGPTKAVYHEFKFDDNGNLTYLRDYQNAVYSLSMSYDGLDRLSVINSSSRGGGKVNYDEMGNITDYKLGSRQLDYQYDSEMKLKSISGEVSYSFSYDDRGNVVDNGRGQRFTYNLAQHTTSASSDGRFLHFIYDGKDKRVLKSIEGKESYFVYGFDGKLLSKVDNGIPSNQIYLNDKLIAENINNTPPPKKNDVVDIDPPTDGEIPVIEPTPPVIGPGLPVNPEW